MEGKSLGVKLMFKERKMAKASSILHNHGLHGRCLTLGKHRIESCQDRLYDTTTQTHNPSWATTH